MSATTDTDIAAPVSSGLPDAARLPTVEQARHYCAQLARSHYENFNVGGWITPVDKLPHVHTIYAWCRTVDDLGDKTLPEAPSSDPSHSGHLDADVAQHRLARLDWWESELNAVYHGQPTHPVTIALQSTVAQFNIPPDPFRKLIHANRMDQGNGRFASHDEVLHYCEHSANPVGHLYLHLFGHSDPERQRLADFTCTALQLTNFWQDVARDYRDRGRIYIPQNDLARFGVTEADIAAGSPTDAFRALLRYECAVAMHLFQRGAPLTKTLDRRARLPIALFTRGGVAVLEAIHRQDYDVLTRRPSLSKGRKGWLLASAWLGNLLGFGYGLPTADTSR